MNDTMPDDVGRMIADRMRGAVGERPAVPIYASAIPQAKRHPARWIGGGVGVLAAGAAAALVVVTAAPGSVPAVPAVPLESPSVAAGATPPVSASPDLPTITSTGILVNPDVPNTPHKVVVYFDYRCPACKSFETTYGAALERAAQKGTISLEDRATSLLDYQDEGSMRAAVAAACLADVDPAKYLAYHRELMAHSPSEGETYTDAQLRTSLPAAAGITGSAAASFQACYDGLQTQPFVERVDNAATTTGVTSWPAVEVDGKLANDYATAVNQVLGKPLVKPAPMPADNQAPVKLGTVTPGKTWKRYDLTNLGLSVELPPTMAAYTGSPPWESGGVGAPSATPASSATPALAGTPSSSVWVSESSGGSCWYLQTKAAWAVARQDGFMVCAESPQDTVPAWWQAYNDGTVLKDLGVVGGLTDKAGAPVHIGLAIPPSLGAAYWAFLMARDSSGTPAYIVDVSGAEPVNFSTSVNVAKSAKNTQWGISTDTAIAILSTVRALS